MQRWKEEGREEVMVIKIKKANKGKFTAKAKRAGMSVKAYAAKVLKKGSKASPATKKQANFARNASKWRKR
jgi:ribosomal protein L31E